MALYYTNEEKKLGNMLAGTVFFTNMTLIGSLGYFTISKMVERSGELEMQSKFSVVRKLADTNEDGNTSKEEWKYVREELGVPHGTSLSKFNFERYMSNRLDLIVEDYGFLKNYSVKTKVDAKREKEYMLKFYLVERLADTNKDGETSDDEWDVVVDSTGAWPGAPKYNEFRLDQLDKYIDKRRKK